MKRVKVSPDEKSVKVKNGHFVYHLWAIRGPKRLKVPQNTFSRRGVEGLQLGVIHVLFQMNQIFGTICVLPKSNLFASCRTNSAGLDI